MRFPHGTIYNGRKTPHKTKQEGSVNNLNVDHQENRYTNYGKLYDDISCSQQNDIFRDSKLYQIKLSDGKYI